MVLERVGSPTEILLNSRLASLTASFASLLLEQPLTIIAVAAVASSSDRVVQVMRGVVLNRCVGSVIGVKSLLSLTNRACRLVKGHLFLS